MAQATLVNTYPGTGDGGLVAVSVPNVQANDTLVVFGGGIYETNAPTLAVAGSGGAGGAGTPVKLGADLGDGGGEANQRMTAWRVEATGATGTRVVTVTYGGNESTAVVVHLRGAGATLGTVSDLMVPRNDSPAAAQALPSTTGANEAILIGAWAGVQFAGTLGWAASAPIVERAEATHSSGFTSLMVASQFLTAAGATGTRTATGSPRPDSGFAGKMVAVAGVATVAAPVVDAGADATITAGGTFTRTAGETGAGITSRAWTVVSGPTGVGTTLATAAALAVQMSTAGTFVLRYSATNSGGTGSDDVTVTVVDPPSSGPERVNYSTSPTNRTSAGAGTWYDTAGAAPQVTDLSGMDRGEGVRTDAAGSMVTARFAVTSGTTVASSLQVRSAVSGTVAFGVDYYSDTEFLSSTPGSVSVVAGQAVRVGAAGTVPAGAVEAAFAADLPGPSEATAHLVEVADTVGSYFDGDTAGAAWDGTPYASTSRLSTAPTLVETYTAEALNAPATLTTGEFTPREGEVLVVKATAGHSDTVIGVVSGGGSAVPWVAASNTTNTNYTPVRTFAATVGPDPSPMTVTVPFTRAAGPAQRGPTLVVERWAYATVGAVAAAIGPSGGGVPNVVTPSAEVGARQTWIVADWQAVTGTATYVAGQTETHARRTSSVLNAWTAYSEPATTAGDVGIGLTAPAGQRWRLATVELLPGPAPVEAPTFTTAAERYGWGTPLESSDEFDYTGAPDPARWGVYDGEGHAGNGTRDPAQVAVQDGYLRITGTADGATGGISHQFDQQYGRWEVRARFGPVTPGSAGESYHAVLIVWPTTEAWPQDGEYDWLEVEDVESTQVGGYLHLPHPDGDPVVVEQIQVSGPTVDFTEWRNYAFEWVEGSLKGYVDGEPWFDLDGSQTSSNGRRLDSMPGGHLTIQLDNFTGTSGLQPAYMDAEWARVYAIDGASTPIGYGTGELGATVGADGGGDKTADGGSTAAAAFDGSSVGDRGATGTGTVELAADTAAAAGPVTRRGTGTTGAVLAAAGVGDGARTSTGTTGLEADGSGGGSGARTGTGLAGLAGLDAATAAGGGVPDRTGVGVTGAALDAAAQPSPADRTGAGPAGVVVDTAGSGYPAQLSTGHATAGAALAAAAAGGPTVRTGRATAGLDLAAAGGGDAVRSSTGTAGATLAEAGGGLRTAPGTGQAGHALSVPVPDPGPVTRDGDGEAALDAYSAGNGAGRDTTGAAFVELELDAAGTGTHASAGTGETGAELGATGTPGVVDRAGLSATAAALDAFGGGDRDTTGTGTTGLDLGTDTLGAGEVRGRGITGLALDATATGDSVRGGAGLLEHTLDAAGGGARDTAGSGLAGIALGEYGENTTRTGHGAATPLELGDGPGGGYRVATGTGRAGLALDGEGGGTRRAPGTGTTGLALDEGGAGLRGGRGAGSTAIEAGEGPVGGLRTGVGAGVVDGLTLDEGAAAGATVRPGRGETVLALAATAAGGPNTRSGSGAAGLALRGAGSAQRNVGGRGRTGLRVGARPRRYAPGRGSVGSHTAAALSGSHTSAAHAATTGGGSP